MGIFDPPKMPNTLPGAPEWDNYWDLDEDIDETESTIIQGCVLSDKELIDATYVQQSGTNNYDVLLGVRHPIISRNGYLVKAKDPISGCRFTAQLKKDPRFKSTPYGEPVKLVRIIDKK